VSAPPQLGLKATFESIDNRGDFRVYMQNYAFARSNTPFRGPRREGPEDQGFVRPDLLRGDILFLTDSTQLPPIPNHADKSYNSGGPGSSNGAPSGPQQQHHTSSASLDNTKGGFKRTFGVDLAEQMIRDNVEVPPIMEKCCQAIEKYGIELQGIYRLSGMVSKVQRLKERLDRGAWSPLSLLLVFGVGLLIVWGEDLDSVSLDAEEWSADINNVSSVMKLWLRELPEPLLTFPLHQGFIEAASMSAR